MFGTAQLIVWLCFFNGHYFYIIYGQMQNIELNLTLFQALNVAAMDDEQVQEFDITHMF